MSIVAVEGVYKDGKIELAETPEGVSESSRVIVTFLDVKDAERTELLRKEAARRAIARMRKGMSLGGPPYLTRDEIYEERLRRYRERGG